MPRSWWPPPDFSGSAEATAYPWRVATAVPSVAAEASLNQLATRATLNCLVGCAAGEIVGMVVGTALGFSNLGTIVLAVALAFVFGYALTSMPLLQSGLTLAVVIPIAVAADTVSITIMEAIDNAFVAVVPGAMDAGLADALFWAPLLGGFALAFGPAFLVNRANIRRGKGCCPGSRVA
jgi:hypothetical protein